LYDLLSLHVYDNENSIVCMIRYAKLVRQITW